MNNKTIAMIQLDGLIAGMEMNSSIPVQLSELKLIKQLLTASQQTVNPCIKAVAQLNAANPQPPLRAVPMSLFPSMSSLQAVVDSAYSQLPITDKNVMHSLLMTYHNTLLKEVNHG